MFGRKWKWTTFDVGKKQNGEAAGVDREYRWAI